MEFEEQTAAVRQMKELLRDQAKFRAKLDRVVRKIETSSQRTAKLAERNKTRKPSTKTGGSKLIAPNGDGESESLGNGSDLHSANGDSGDESEMHLAGATSAQPVS